MHPTCVRPAFKSRVVPVIVIHDARLAVPLAEALLAGGVDVMEITLRHKEGLPAIEAVAKAVPAMAIGAGTVTRASEIKAIKDAGANFALSPGMSDALIQAAFDAAIPFIPGVMTPSEIMKVRDWGFNLVKFFPATQAGGTAMLKALAGPLGDMMFCPTGGISLENMRDYLTLANVAMVGGSWLTPPALLEQKNWGEITRIAKLTVAAANHSTKN